MRLITQQISWKLTNNMTPCYYKHTSFALLFQINPYNFLLIRTPKLWIFLSVIIWYYNDGSLEGTICVWFSSFFGWFFWENWKRGLLRLFLKFKQIRCSVSNEAWWIVGNRWLIWGRFCVLTLHWSFYCRRKLHCGSTEKTRKV